MEQRRQGIIAADHPALAGHFHGNPIVPGVVLLEEVLQLARSMADGVRVIGVDGVKFLVPLRPLQVFTVTLAAAQNGRRRFECHRDGQCIAQGILLIERSG